MSAELLLDDFRRRGIRLIPNPPKLAVEPASKLTNADREAIRQHKADLLVLLAADRERAGIIRIARLEAERREADRHAQRGYDFDPTAPSHADYVGRTDPLSDPAHCAYGLVAICQCYGVALRIDSGGALVVGKADARAEEATQPWPSLVLAIEAHTDAVARLVEAGWSLRADFPKGATA